MIENSALGMKFKYFQEGSVFMRRFLSVLSVILLAMFIYGSAALAAEVIITPDTVYLSLESAHSYGTRDLMAIVSYDNKLTLPGSVSWISSAPSIASVNTSGRVTAVGAGTATITATVGGESATCNVIVSSTYTFTERVTLDKTNINLVMGDTDLLRATFSPSNATIDNLQLVWRTGNPDVATVNKGFVTAIGAGTTTITVEEFYGVSASCTITVSTSPLPTVSVTGVSLNRSAMTLSVGSSDMLTETVLPANATNKNVSWRSNNDAVATIINGLVTAHTPGMATITVETQDGNHTADCIVTVTGTPAVNVTGVILDKSTITLPIGGSDTLTETVLPANATNKNVTWRSDSQFVASVVNGVVMAHTPGTATITVETQDGRFTADCFVTVTVPVTGVRVSPTSLELAIGGSDVLLATIEPFNATNDSVTWISSNTSVVTVTSGGLVTARGVGTATITVETVDGQHTDTCSISVTNTETIPVTGVTVTPTSVTLIAGETRQLTATVEPASADNKSVTWSTSDREVATVTASGLTAVVTANNAGTATITVETEDGTHTALCVVTVPVV